MKRRFLATAVVGMVLVAIAAPLAGAQDVTQSTAAITALPLDGTRSIDTVGYSTVNLTGARSGMTGTLGVRVVEAIRNGNTPIRVKASSSDLTCGAVTALRKNLSVSNRSGNVSYIVGQANPGSSTAIASSSALGDATTNASTPADVFLIEGESPNNSYTTAVTPHVATGTLTFVVPADVPAQACAGTLTYDMFYV